MERYLRHRYALAVPFVVLALVTVLGGILNGNTARGRLIDDLTDEGAKNGAVTHGTRRVEADAEGYYVMENVPRTSKLRIDAPGYTRTAAPGTGGDVRLVPLSITMYVNEAGSPAAELKRVATAQFRRDNIIVGTTNASGNTVIAPHPGRDAKLLVCAKDYETKEITVRGVEMTIELVRREGNDCPPLPTPSPPPGASPSPSPSPSPSAP